MSLAKTLRRKERLVNRSDFGTPPYGMQEGDKARFYTFSGGKSGGWVVVSVKQITN
ncbi:hypothetical protein [Aquiflexum gelatinilyticum]|uniref:hypothetical protein n=1 Tax=Aquiflexum gelatinilyticum TaxID=2961943 RepID=UPI0021684FF6|nr:hypothetical protein [Aquiflexum gelatinilyticum]MCS4436904.1 hypothetical protein [Aquiflexum gelatinilyticum]